MPKGGHAHSGPPPDPNALRRDRDGSEWVTLPAAGRSGPVPEWPLTEASDRELGFWDQMWVRPQAVMWELRGQHHEVALYVRRLVEAERPGSPVAVSTMVRQLLDSLGLSSPGLRANRWRIGDAAPRDTRASSVPRRTSARDRFRVVDGDGA